MEAKSLFKCWMWRILVIIIILGMIGGCATVHKDMIGPGAACSASTNSEEKELPPEAYKNIDELFTVDCLLPGQLIQIGMHQQYLTPSRPAVLTAWECKVQGGQYAKTSDKDGRQNALKVWQGCANQGDEVAQNYMGEIYGRSWGEVKPDYVQAAGWYRKSAEQGYSRALNNLGFLYEHGLGVQKSKQEALDLYRRAMGEIELIELDQKTKDEINRLEFKLNTVRQITKDLEEKLHESKQIVQKQQMEINYLSQVDNVAADQQAQLEKVNKELRETSERERKLKEQLFIAQQKLEVANNELIQKQNRVAFENIPDMGKYYALIIGIEDYDHPLDTLETPVEDAIRVDEILRNKYGFETTLLIDNGSINPTKDDFYKALYDYKKKITNKDNLLIYFAGHGKFRSGSGYWLLQGADDEIPTNWLSSDDITREIQFMIRGKGGLKARNVLVVADSCYGAALTMSWFSPDKEQVVASMPNGLSTRSANATFIVQSQEEPIQLYQTDGQSTESAIALIKKQHELPSRLQLSSGGLEPVLDEAYKNGLSIFANAFTEVLSANEGIISAEDIYRRIKPQVYDQAMKNGFDQTPVYRQIPNAGGNNGGFFFVSR